MSGYPEIDDPTVFRAVVEWARRGARPNEVLRTLRGDLPEGVSQRSIFRTVAVATHVLLADRELCPATEPDAWGRVRYVPGDELRHVRDNGTGETGVSTAVERAIWEVHNPTANPHAPCEHRLSLAKAGADELARARDELARDRDELRRDRDELRRERDELGRRLGEQEQKPCARCSAAGRVFKCQICHRVFRGQGYLMNHTILKHNGDGRARRGERETAKEKA